jgi:hypothetical protein
LAAVASVFDINDSLGNSAEQQACYQLAGVSATERKQVVRINPVCDHPHVACLLTLFAS